MDIISEKIEVDFTDENITASAGSETCQEDCVCLKNLALNKGKFNK